MAADFNSWRKVESADWPEFLCPTCKDGRLKILKSSIREEETALSKKKFARKTEPKPLEHILMFSGRLKCDNDKCKNVVFVCGRAKRKKCGDKSVTKYRPRYFEPTIPVFNIPQGCPKEVQHPLSGASSLVWSNHRACAIRLRVALEALLVDQKFRKKDERGRIDGGIKKLCEKFPVSETQLDAIRTTGNTGGHNDEKTILRREIVSMFYTLQRTLNVVYEKGAEN